MVEGAATREFAGLSECQCVIPGVCMFVWINLKSKRMQQDIS